MDNLKESQLNMTQTQFRGNEGTTQPSSSLSKHHRNAIEKNRRTQMKQLYSRLTTLVSSPTSQEKLPLPALLDRATECVNQMKMNIEELKKMKEQLKGGGEIKNEDKSASSMVPIISVRELGTTLEVNLIAGINNKFMVHQVFRVLQEEGAEVVSASYSTTGNKIYYTIHSQAILTRIGVDTSRVHQKLQKLVSELSHLASLTIS